jgi:hypothetical protein
MFAHPFIFVIAFAPAILLSQAPEFTQQYRQRLGGAVDELQRIILHFDEDSRRSGYDRLEALRLMANNPERLIRDQASRMEKTIARLSRLREQQDAFRHGGPFVRLASFVTNFDRPLAQRTFEVYEPAVPVTMEALLFAIGGFFVPYFLMAMVAEAWRRRRLWAQPHRSVY